jgi:hypothetical protein
MFRTRQGKPNKVRATVCEAPETTNETRYIDMARNRSRDHALQEESYPTPFFHPVMKLRRFGSQIAKPKFRRNRPNRLAAPCPTSHCCGETDGASA